MRRNLCKNTKKITVLRKELQKILLIKPAYMWRINSIKK